MGLRVRVCRYVTGLLYGTIVVLEHLNKMKCEIILLITMFECLFFSASDQNIHAVNGK